MVSEGGQQDVADGEDRPFAMKRVGRHSIVYGAGILFGRVVAFVMLPIYTHYLTPSDYGVMELVAMTLNIIAIAAGTRIGAGILRYYWMTNDPDGRNAVVSTTLIVIVLTYTAACVPTILAANPLSRLVFGTPEHGYLIRLAASSLAFSALSWVPLAYARARGLSTLYVVSDGARLALQIPLNVVFLAYFGLGVESIFLSTLIANVVMGVGLTAWMLRAVGTRFSRGATRNLLRYGIPLIATEIATFAMTFGDRYFIQAESDSAAVGLYALAAQFALLVAGIGYRAFEMVWEPTRFAVANRSDRDELYARAFVYLNLSVVTCAMGVSMLSVDVIRLLTPPEFHPAAVLVPFLACSFIFQGWIGLQDVGIHLRERTEFIAVANWIAAGVALIGLWIFVPRYLGMGAAVVTLGAFFLRYLLIFWFSQRLVPVRYQWGPVYRLLALALLTYGLGTLVPADSLGRSIAVKSVLVALYGLTVWRLVLSPADRGRVGVLYSQYATRGSRLGAGQ